jgi:hypothetical protein
MKHRYEPDLTKGLLAGAPAGVVASFLMEQFQSLWTGISKEVNPRADGSESKDESSNVQATQAISKALTNQKIRKRNNAKAGEIMHYAMGGTSGAIYGMTAELLPLATLGEGLAFGTTVWVAADNIVVPALGLAKPPVETSLSTHIYALSSDVVYGLVTETIRRAVRSVL